MGAFEDGIITKPYPGWHSGETPIREWLNVNFLMKWFGDITYKQLRL
jgi:hypothetical protein